MNRKIIPKLLQCAFVAAASWATSVVCAQDAATADSAPSPRSSGTSEDVTIRAGENRTIFEYRQNGHLRMIKIVPRLGRPYFLVPADPTKGYGDLEHGVKLVPSWRIVEF